MWGGCWGRCGDADACVLFIFDLLTRAADQRIISDSDLGGVDAPEDAAFAKVSQIQIQIQGL